jgi:hypothetical protein
MEHLAAGGLPMRIVQLLTGVLIAIVSCAAAMAVTLPPEDAQQQSAFCKKQWTKRDVLDQGMYQYCMGLQDDGYAKLEELATRYMEEPWNKSL